jgi:hypothetical protein
VGTGMGPGPAGSGNLQTCTILYSTWRFNLIDFLARHRCSARVGGKQKVGEVRMTADLDGWMTESERGKEGSRKITRA